MPPGGPPSPKGDTGVSGQAIVREAEKFIGTPYVWGGAAPGGFDCSGLVQYVLTRLGVRGVPRTSEAQWAWVRKVPANQVQPGDLVFFTGDLSGGDSSPGHVGIVDSTGRSWRMIDAPFTGADVRQDTFTVPGGGTGHIVGFGRPPGVASSGVGASVGSQPGGGFGLSLPAQVTGFFSDAEDFAHAALWFVNPENWMRIVAGVLGLFALVAGVLVLAKAAQ